MKKRRMEMIPKPRSNFIKVKCPECGNEQAVFERASITVHCNICNAPLVVPTGGKALLKGEVLSVLG
ncbi:MAG: 30S ribosomal protein S27e [Candidatus Bathyarchaeia archaeon]